MAKKKTQKRPHSRAVERKRLMEQEKLANEKSRAKNRWNPAGRALLYGDLIFLAFSLFLESQALISRQVSGFCTVLSFIMLLMALWLLFGKKQGGVEKGRTPGCKKD